jgi:prolyl oligopeptidase
MNTALAALALVVLMPVASAPTAPAAAPVPATPARPVTDVLHGVSVRDDYRWLEDGGDAQVRAWSDAQNAHARAFLDTLPDLPAIRADVSATMKLSVIRHFGLRLSGDRLFALRSQPPRQQPTLVVMPSSGDVGAERTVLDPMALDAKGGVSIDWFEPSPDGGKVAVSLSRQGSELGDLHVYEVASGRELPDVVGRVNGGTAGGSAVWDEDGSGLYYTRYPHQGERPAADLDFYTQVWHHTLGKPTQEDRYEIGRDFPRIAEIFLQRSRDGRWVLANVQNGDGGEYAQYLRGSDGRWTQVGVYADRIMTLAFGPGTLFGVSLRGTARGRVLALPLPAVGAPGDWSHARVVVPEGEPAIEFDVFSHSLATSATALLVRDEVGGPEQIRVFDFDGKPRGLLPLPPVASVVEVATSPASDAVLYSSTTFTEPLTVWQADAAHPETAARRTVLAEPWPVDFSDVEVLREWATSKDGTRVPMTIVRKKGTPVDHQAPTILTGYGGFALSSTPGFSPVTRLWFDHGGILAVANTRGGSELGEAWYDGGRLTRKQNVFDDFLACADHLVQAGYTNPSRLAIQGGSNGGLLMGAALTQRPELFRAVVSHVGIYDMLRVELSPNGQFNVTEYGSVRDPEQFRALYAYSPYHHVTDGARYPAVMFLTGANDPRVDPMESRKMTARLQAATGGQGTILLRTSGTSGHGIGTALDERVAQAVDVYSFLFHELGVPYGPPKAPVKAPEGHR